MMLTLLLTPEEEVRLLAQARARGMSPDTLVRNAVKELLDKPQQPSSTQPGKISPEEWDKEFDELLDSLPGLPTLSDEAISRESIYTREDER